MNTPFVGVDFGSPLDLYRSSVAKRAPSLGLHAASVVFGEQTAEGWPVTVVYDFADADQALDWELYFALSATVSGGALSVVRNMTYEVQGIRWAQPIKLGSVSARVRFPAGQVGVWIGTAIADSFDGMGTVPPTGMAITHVNNFFGFMVSGVNAWVAGAPVPANGVWLSYALDYDASPPTMTVSEPAWGTAVLDAQPPLALATTDRLVLCGHSGNTDWDSITITGVVAP